MKKENTYRSTIRHIGMVSTTGQDRTEKLGITLLISLLKQIDNKRGDVPRSRYIRRAIESYLKGAGRNKRW